MSSRNLHGVVRCVLIPLALCLCVPSLYANDSSPSSSVLPSLFTPLKNLSRVTLQRQSPPKISEKSTQSRRMNIDIHVLDGIERLTINLFDNVEVDVVATARHTTASGRKSWRGTIHQQRVDGVTTSSSGNVTLIHEGDGVIGTVRFAGRLFTIDQEQGRVHRIREIDVAHYPNDHPEQRPVMSPAGFPSTGFSPANVPRPPLARSAAAEIRVLVVYPKSVAANAPDVIGLIDLVIDETNQTFVNSALDSPVTLTLAGAEPISFPETSYPDMLDQLASPFDGVFDEVHHMRLDYAADIVVMLSSKQDFCGYGYIGADYTQGFAVVNFTCASGNFSFAHEIGHLVGARHDIQHDSLSMPYVYGHGHQSPNALFRTIMAYNCAAADCPRQAFWSNPDTVLFDEAMGAEGVSDVAQVWDVNGHTLATFHEHYVPPDHSREQWFFDIQDRVYASPVVNEQGVVYVAGRDAVIYALHDDMSVKWQTAVSQGITASLVLENGLLFYRTTDAGEREYGALDAETGERQWHHLFTGSGDAPAVAPNGDSYVMDGSTLKHIASTGELLGTATVYPTTYVAPVIGHTGNVYVTSITGIVYGFDATLAPLWTYTLPETYLRTCMVVGAEEQLYIQTHTGQVYGMSGDGALLWQYSLDPPQYDLCPVIDANHHIIVGSGTYLNALTPAGELVWQSEPFDHVITSTPAIADNGDVFVGTQRRLQVVSATGDRLWSALLQQNNRSSVVLSHTGLAYIGEADATAGGLRAFAIGDTLPGVTPWSRYHGNNAGTSRVTEIPNRAPELSIHSPEAGARFVASEGAILLQAAATDHEDGELSEAIRWHSSLDGALTSPALLSVGAHQLVATVEDSRGEEVSQTIAVAVVGDADLSVVLEGTPGKNNDGLIRFAATVDNLGQAASIDTVISLVLPEESQLVSVMHQEHALACEEGDRTVTCELDDVAPHAPSVVDFTVTTGEYTPTKMPFDVQVSARNDAVEENNQAASVFGGSLGIAFYLLILGGMIARKVPDVIK